MQRPEECKGSLGNVCICSHSFIRQSAVTTWAAHITLSGLNVIFTSGALAPLNLIAYVDPHECASSLMQLLISHTPEICSSSHTQEALVNSSMARTGSRRSLSISHILPPFCHQTLLQLNVNLKVGLPRS